MFICPTEAEPSTTTQSRPREIAAEIGPGLAKAALAAEVDGQLVGLDYALPDDGDVQLRILTRKDPEALAVMRHSCAHVMARAVMRLHPRACNLAFGPTVEGGFYYDFDLDEPLSEEDFPAIEAEMQKIIKADEPFERIEEPREKALQICRDLEQPYKVEHIEEGWPNTRRCRSIGRASSSICAAGPTCPPRRRDRRVQAAVAGRRLLERRRVPASNCSDSTARRSSPSRNWKSHLKLVEEAKKRDHRVLGKRLDLFTISPLVGSGLVLWQPKGAIVRGLLENFIKDELQRRGYLPVYTPNIGRIELYKTSGHYPYYKDSMFTPIVMEDDEQYPAQADELPASHHDLQVQAAQLPRVAAAAGRVRHGLPLRAIGRAVRHDARARVHSGRRAHLLHARAGGRTNSAAASR